MKIAVFLGAGFGNNSYWRQFTEETGTWIGKNGHTLIYGGSKTGLMGVLADAVLKEKGEVIGVETQDFIRLDVQHPALTKLISAKDMAERKQIMIENADAPDNFIGKLNCHFCFQIAIPAARITKHAAVPRTDGLNLRKIRSFCPDFSSLLIPHLNAKN